MGTKLFHRARINRDRNVTAVIVSGGIKFGSRIYTTPTGAAYAVTKKPVDGWLFWKTGHGSVRLGDLRER